MVAAMQLTEVHGIWTGVVRYSVKRFRVGMDRHDVDTISEGFYSLSQTVISRDRLKHSKGELFEAI
jgi:hypothetical protein